MPAAGRMRDDTRAFLRVSSIIEITGILCVILVYLTGGFAVHGPHNTVGWLGLLVALGCLPTGSLFLLIGLGKWYEDRRRVS